jgi:hypothetical protein
MHILIRVELHAATTVAQYEGLHSAMQQAGFQRTIPGGQNSQWQLPTASYYSNRFATVDQAKNAAWQAARGIATAYAVVASGPSIVWEGLERQR